MKKYGDGVYSLAGMNATLKPGKPSVKISASGSNVTATITVSASAVIKDGSRSILTLTPKLSFTQSLSVQTNVKGGKFWIDMSVTLRSTSRISLTVTASSGGSVKLFNDAKKTLSEIVKPEGLKDSNDYSKYDKNVSELMKTVGSIVNSSLVYNDIFNVVLLKLRFSFYGIISLGVDINFVGQVGVLATFGVEIEVKSGERIGFEYKFLKFKGKSYTQKLESSVTSNIYLIGKVGARVGIRVTISITFCGFISTSIEGSVYAYAELSGFYYNTANLLSGASTEFGALRFEVGIDVVVKLQLKVKLIFKTKKKSWTVYSGRWPVWSKSYSSGFSYMNQEKLASIWKSESANADQKNSFGFTSIPMKNWDMAKGTCKESTVLTTQKEAGISLEIQNLKVDGKTVSTKDPLAKLFYVGNGKNNTSPGFIYLDQNVAGKYNCKKAELDLVVTYTNKSKTAVLKKQVSKFHLSKKIQLVTTKHTVKVVLSDWCAKEWGLDSAGWDNALVYENTFTNSHCAGQKYTEKVTAPLNLDQIVQKARSTYPELAGMECEWTGRKGNQQYGTGNVRECVLDPKKGTIQYKAFPDNRNYETTYYLYVHRFKGESSQVNYHISLTGKESKATYRLWVTAADGSVKEFKQQRNGSYDLTINKRDFSGEQQGVMMSVNGEPAQETSLSITGRESQKDVYLQLDLRKVQIVINAGDGVKTFKAYGTLGFRRGQISNGTIQSGTKVEIQVDLEKGYGDLEVVSTYKNFKYAVKENKITFLMPQRNMTVVLQAYKRHKAVYEYNLEDYGTYKTVFSTEKQKVKAPKNPSVPGYVFKGWYPTADGSGKPYEFGKVLKEDLTLYAKWEPELSPEQILELAASALSGHYTDSLENYLPLESTAEKLQAAITEKLKESLEKEKVYQLYGKNLSFVVELSDKVEETEKQYNYTYTAKIFYKDLTKKEWKGTASGSFTLEKMKPEVSVLPVAGNLKYQEKLAQSSFTGGEVTYKEEKVTGSFSWNDPELVPEGEENETAKYKATFTPDAESAKLYTSVEFELPVKTQIGVRVSCKADSRDYERGNDTTTGTYELTRAGDGMKLTDLELTGGVFRFERETPGENLKVTFSGYKIREDQNTDNLYVLLNTTAETTASIRGQIPADPPVRDEPIEDIPVEDEKIQSHLKEMLIGEYEDSVEKYLPIGEMDDKVKETTVSIIKNRLEQDEFLKEYQDRISITVEIQGERETLADAHTYTLAVEAVLETPNGDTYTAAGNYHVVIKKLTPEVKSAPTVAGEFEVGTKLEDIKNELGKEPVLTEGEVTYGGENVNGSWEWENPETVLSQIGEAAYNMRFIPEDTDKYNTVEAMVIVPTITASTTKTVVNIPGIQPLIYNGQKQAPNIEETDTYKVTQNEEHIDSGEYSVTLELKNPELYSWPGSEEKSITLPYKIQKAKAEITGTLDEEKLTLIYGQKLSDGTEPDRDKKKTLIAKDMISGIQVKFEETELAGEWQWNLEETQKQPLTYKEEGYSIKAVFNFADENIAKNIEPIEKLFTVKVKKALPKLECYDFSGILYCSRDEEGNIVGNSLSKAVIRGHVEAKNSITDETVAGTWTTTPVEDSVIEKEGGEFEYKLTFAPEDTVNYSEAVIESMNIEIRIEYEPVISTETPSISENPAPTEDSLLPENPTPTETLTQTENSVLTEIPTPTEIPVPEEEPAPDEDSKSTENPEPTEDSVSTENPESKELPAETN